MMFTSVRQHPQNITGADENLFRHEYEKTFPAPELLQLHDVICDENLRISNINKYPAAVAEKAAPYRLPFRSFIKKLLQFKISIRTKPVVMITDSWSGGYFHWLLDCLPRLMVVKDQLQDQEIILPHFLSGFSFVKESLGLLGVNRFSFAEKNRLYFFRKVIFPTHTAPTGNYNDEIIRQLRNAFTKKFRTEKKETVVKIYISRTRTARRKISNESSLIPLLKENGYQIVYCEEMSFEDQVKLFASADSLISNHGAGLSNMLFMKEGSKVLEMRFPSDAQNNCYFSLASALNISYYYLQGTVAGEDHDPHTANINADADALRLFIQQHQF